VLKAVARKLSFGTENDVDCQEDQIRIPTNVLGYTTLRLAIGMSMFIHGIARIGHVPAFAETMAKMFASSGLSPGAVRMFAWVTPPIELFIGLLVLVGLWTLQGLLLGGVWMVVLIFGSTLIEDYNIVGIQLVYSLIFFHLLQNLEFNTLSVDRFLFPGKFPHAEQPPAVDS
jgi:thiosulfate dehydrogenase [quinone] large subunit